MRTASLLKTRTDSRGTDQAEEGSPYGFQGLLLLEEGENVHKYKRGGGGLSYLLIIHIHCKLAYIFPSRNAPLQNTLSIWVCHFCEVSALHLVFASNFCQVEVGHIWKRKRGIGKKTLLKPYWAEDEGGKNIVTSETLPSLRPFLAINEALSQQHHFIMIYESLILMQQKTNHLQQVSRQSIRHHVFDTTYGLGHSFKLKALICKYTLADKKKDNTHFLFWCMKE